MNRIAIHQSQYIGTRAAVHPGAEREKSASLYQRAYAALNAPALSAQGPAPTPRANGKRDPYALSSKQARPL